MAYTAPTVADFQARFPAFANVGTTTVQGALDLAAPETDASWPDAKRREGVMLYAAHSLSLDGLGSSTEAQLKGIKSISLGSLSITSAASDTKATSVLASTSYGERFAALAMSVRGPAVLVV